MATAKKPRAVNPDKKTGKKVRFLHKPNCTTCRKAQKFMERRGFQLNFRDLAKERLSAAELEKLIGPRDHTKFLNSRNELFRRKKMKTNPPSRKEAVRMMSVEPNLIRRPVIVAGKRVVLGFDEPEIKKL
ncbi:MAG TPA: ArsC/Spx/MgsR family protein [Candidatus Dormibacteraeota bacterium]|nr:ArsC/Spx/MgsR family protein [Candidatus Dormibacteraeota bacterium]